ncbi:hypothetical protein FB451DRAFT_1570874, partial [Mycena latifolia]
HSSSLRLTEAAASHATCAVLKSKPARRRWSDGTHHSESFSRYVSSARAGGPGSSSSSEEGIRLLGGEVSTPLRLNVTSRLPPGVEALQGAQLFLSLAAVRPIPSLPFRRQPTQARHSRARGSPRGRARRVRGPVDPAARGHRIPHTL